MIKLFSKKGNDKKSIFDVWYSRVLLGLFCIALIFIGVKYIISLFNNSKTYDYKNIEQYILKEDTQEIDDTKIVTDYSTFHTIQGVVEQFINALINGEYEKTYDVIDKEYLDSFKTKKEYLNFIEEYSKSNFIIKEKSTDFVNTNRVKKIYKLSLNEDYLVEYKNVDGILIKIGVRLISKERKYKIIYLDKMEEKNEIN